MSRCKFCGKDGGILKSSNWYEFSWSSLKGTFKLEPICPTCALSSDLKLQKVYCKMKKRIKELEKEKVKE